MYPSSEALTLRLVDTLRGLSGVERVRTFMIQGYGIDFSRESNEWAWDYNDHGNIVGVEDDTLRELLPFAAEGGSDWDALQGGVGVLAVNSKDDYLTPFNYEQDRDIKAYLTDKVESITEQTTTLRVVGILDSHDVPPYAPKTGNLPLLLMPQSLYEAKGFDSAYLSVSLKIDTEKHAALTAAIRDICLENGDLFYRSYLEDKRELERQSMGMTALAGILLGVIALAAILNLIGATFIGIEQRQREFGVLAALGLSPKGLRGMLTREGAIISAAAVCFSAVPGLGGGYALYRFMANKIGGGISYGFPLAPFLALCLIYGFVPYLITRAATRRLSRRTVTELLGQDT